MSKVMTEKCTMCGQVIPGKVMTNGDMIRRMTDEELAEGIMCPGANGMGRADITACPPGGCTKCSLEWLRKEVKK